MFSEAIAFFTGLNVKQEKNNVVSIAGIKTEPLLLSLENRWRTSKLGGKMFRKMRRMYLEIDDFFLPDFAYIVNTLMTDRKARVSRRMLQDVLNGLHNETWLKQTVGAQPRNRLNWSKLSGLKWAPLEHQDLFWKIYENNTEKYNLNGYILGAAPGSGKATVYTTPVKVPGGWQQIGKLKVGDKVATRDGTYVDVIGVYPQGKKQLFKVTFEDGRTIEACAEHLWQYNDHHTEKSGYWKVGNTAEILSLMERSENRRIYIPLCEAIEDNAVEHVIDPYLLGVLLGDGCISHNAVGWCKPDDFIVDEVKKLLPEYLEISEYADGKQKNIKLKEEFKNEFSENPYRAELESLGLMGSRSWEKFIPDEYMHGSVDQRFALIQGLMDTDGYIDEQSTCSFVTTSEKMALQMQELIRSVGGKAKLVPKMKTYTYNGEVRTGRVAYQLNIKFTKPSMLFRLPRKKDRANDEGQYSNNKKLKIVSIEPSRVEEAVCISVDHPERLYVTKDYIVTHNTFMGIGLSEMLETDITICVVPKNAVDRVWADTLASVFKEPTSYWTSTSGHPIKPGFRYYVAHYEQIPILLEHFNKYSEGKKINIILDESHNMNEIKSQRCEKFIELCKVTNCKDVLWASGTPIKAMGSEVIPILRTIDPLFFPHVEVRFKEIFGLSSARALDVLAHRLGYMTFKVDKKEVVGNTIRKYRVDVKMPNGERFTLDNVRSEMSKFIKERTVYYNANLRMYHEHYFSALREYEQDLHSSDMQEYKQYRETAKLLHTSYDPMIHKTEPVFCNSYEKRKIIPALGKASATQFKNARSVYKYLSLKIQGEALGRILGRMRSECNASMVRAWENYDVTDLTTGEKFKTNLIDIVDQSEKKSVLFTSYVEVVDQVAEVFKNAGAMPLKVYGTTNKDLPAIVKVFERDPKANPLAATLQSLSTAVPLIMANTVVFLNAPFRSHEYEQAQSRVDRLGQTEIVHIYDVYLDTGNEPNISTRSSDIMDWSKSQVEAIMGVGVGDYAAALEDLREDLSGNDWYAALEELQAESIGAKKVASFSW